MTETLDVEQYEDDPTRCCVCGRDIVEGDEVVWEPSPHIAPNAREVAHPPCSLGNGFRLRWPDSSSPHKARTEEGTDG